MHYLYILKSLKDGTFYKGISDNYSRRFEQHNAGESRYTSRKIPWELVYVEAHESKTEALKRERRLKRCNTDYIKWLIDQDSNILKK